MQYCLDANVFIEAHRRYYAFDIAPGFWNGLARLIDSQVICSPSLVYKELLNADFEDRLVDWAKTNKDALFVEPDEATQDVYSQIADMVARVFEPQHVQIFLSGADPWVIAHAKAHKLTVVTMESLKNEQKNQNGKVGGKIQIPNICKVIAIEYRDTFTLLREQKVVLQ